MIVPGIVLKDLRIFQHPLAPFSDNPIQHVTFALLFLIVFIPALLMILTILIVLKDGLSLEVASMCADISGASYVIQ